MPSAAQPAAPLPELIAERYAVERELGHGGMGRVFVAHDRKLARNVAIKVLAPGAHNEEALRRFEQEARAAGSLNHPNILAVYDIGSHEGGPYIVSELLEGGTLRQRMAGKPMPGRRQSTSPCNWRRGSPPRTRRASSTATSSRRTSSSPTTAG